MNMPGFEMVTVVAEATDGETCIDRWGDEYPEHDYDEAECRRCGAEPES